MMHQTKNKQTLSKQAVIRKASTLPLWEALRAASSSHMDSDTLLSNLLNEGQTAMLDLAERLVTAVDAESIIHSTLELLVSRFEIDRCQYVAYNPETGLGEVMAEACHELQTLPEGDVVVLNADGSSQERTVFLQSFRHCSQQEKRPVVQAYTNLVDLLLSLSRKQFYLHLNVQAEGQRSLSQLFGVQGIQAALILPVVDVTTGGILGTFNLFFGTGQKTREESLALFQQVASLVSKALGRASVLEKALAMASSDELTGLINRRGYYQRFESELERSRRQQTPLTVALIDVDFFKRFNDTYGHLSGDLVLKVLSEVFMQKLRKSDVVCRFGGEEFAVLLPDTGLKAGCELMDRLRQNVESMEAHGAHGESLKVTVSIGIAEVNTQPKASLHRSEISDALARADEQLYKAKAQGRNRVCCS